MRPVEYLDHLRRTYPEITDIVNIIQNNYDNKLWHQLTKQLEHLVTVPVLLERKELANLYNFFIKDFENKLKPISLVEICIVVAKQYNNNEARIFIEEISQKVQKDKAAYILSLSFIASMYLGANNLQECKNTIEAAKTELQGITGLEPVVYSCYYLICTDYNRAKNQAGDFYKNALLYLSYCKLETLPLETQAALAFDLCNAALIGDSVYSFGDLIVHPVLKSLESSKHAWLIQLLKTFNIGDISGYEQVVSQNRELFQSIPALANNTPKLLQKISILSLLELAFRTPSDQRSISFQKISSTTKLPMDDIEHLLMRALSLGLIKGNIDEIEKLIHVTWVTPRILDFNQIASINQRIEEWKNHAKESLRLVESGTVDLIA